MAKLLLLATLAISTFGCGTLGNLHDIQEKDLADSAGGELQLRNGGPTSSGERPKLDPTMADNPVSSDQQIRLRIMLAEVDRPEMRVLGIDMGRKEGDNGAKLPWVLDNGEVRVAIKPVLKRLGSASVLKETTLEVQNGQTASWQTCSGYENIGCTGSTSVPSSRTPFGMELKLTPTAADGNRIRLKMHLAISTRDISVGSSVAGLKTQHLNTTIEMLQGQTFAVAGLVESTFGKESSETSFWDRIPIFNRQVEPDPNFIPRELVLVITPEIVQTSEKKE